MNQFAYTSTDVFGVFQGRVYLKARLVPRSTHIFPFESFEALVCSLKHDLLSCKEEDEEARSRHVAQAQDQKRNAKTTDQHGIVLSLTFSL